MAAKRSTTIANAALTRFQEKFVKTFGEDSIERGSEITPYQVIPTGSLALDLAMGVGGYVEGRLTEIWGPDGIGKTTLAMIGLSEAQKKHQEKQVGWIDMEQRLDLKWAQAHGIDLDRMYRVRPQSAEDVADAMKEMLRSKLFSMIVLDSIGAMLPEAEKEKDADESAMGKQAQIVTRMVKIAAVEAAEIGTAAIFINQVRANLGLGADQTTGGGFALKHSTTHKLRMRRTDVSPFKIKVDGVDYEVGHEVAIHVERNSVAPPKQTARVSLFNQPTAKFGPLGIDRADEAVTVGLRTGVILQNSAWYTLTTTGEKINSREKVVEALRKDPTLTEGIRVAALATIADRIYEEEQPEPESNGNGGFRTGKPEEEELRSSPRPNVTRSDKEIL
jgi:recombination protein RecA